MTYLVYGIDVGPFLKARGTFEDFRRDMKTDRDKAGAIQAFEFSFELAWKTLKRFLHVKGIEVRSPRDCFREAAAVALISNPKQWFLFLEKRNLTVHTYEPKIVEDILKVFDAYSAALDEMIGYIEHEHTKSSSS